MQKYDVKISYILTTLPSLFLNDGICNPTLSVIQHILQYNVHVSKNCVLTQMSAFSSSSSKNWALNEEFFFSDECFVKQLHFFLNHLKLAFSQEFSSLMEAYTIAIFLIQEY